MGGRGGRVLPRGWRLAVLALVTGAVLAIGAASAAAVDLIDPARIPANPEQTPTARASARPSGETKQELMGDAESADRQLDADSSDSGGGSSSPPSQVQWCRWWAFQTTATDLQQNPSIDVYQDLVSNLQACLNQYYSQDPSVPWVSEYLALQNEASLLIALDGTNMTRAYQSLENGVSLPQGTWVAWFQASAAAVPPV